MRLHSRQTKEISAKLIELKKFITCDFSRKPRGVDEINRWKATELRQFLLYTGPLVLKNTLNNCYKHFMSLNIAMIIWLNPSMKQYIDYASNLLHYFVKRFGQIYGIHLMSHNIHGLLHIVDDYNNFSPLDNISCFPFKDFMKTLKQKVRKHEKPLQQVIKRYNEEHINYRKIITKMKTINLIGEHTEGPLLNNLINPQYNTINFENFTIKVKCTKDSYILTKNNEVVQVSNIAHTKNNETVIIGKLFRTKKPFFEIPINSLLLNIYIVKNLNNNLSIGL